MHANLTIDVADDSGVNPEAVPGNAQRANRQLNFGEHVLTRVRQEKIISRTPISSSAWN